MFLVDDNSKHKKSKSVNENVVVTVSHNEYKDFFLKNKCLGHLMNMIQSKNLRIKTYEIKWISLSCFDEKIYIQINGCDGLALGYYELYDGLALRVNYKKTTVILITIQKSFFVKLWKYCFNFQCNQDSLFIFFVLVYMKWLIVNIVQKTINLQN